MIFASYWGSPLLQFSKFNNLIWLRLIFRQKSLQFCIPLWKLDICIATTNLRRYFYCLHIPPNNGISTTFFVPHLPTLCLFLATFVDLKSPIFRWPQKSEGGKNVTSSIVWVYKLTTCSGVIATDNFWPNYSTVRTFSEV